ncbi:carbonic anhydrase, partial [Undibacterium luofuense]|uniref:carbonic anhydrase n=1 Tax=Undibacterium luofuense TaxID=2828733 RepID=UPI0030EB6FAD
MTIILAPLNVQNAAVQFQFHGRPSEARAGNPRSTRRTACITVSIPGTSHRFAGRFRAEQDRLKQLAVKGQKPSTMIISCCDSRVAPEAIFDARPGELFVLRNVAALVPPYEPDDHHHGASAALEYAVMALKVEHIVVLGHGL